MKTVLVIVVLALALALIGAGILIARKHRRTVDVVVEAGKQIGEAGKKVVDEVRK